MKTNIKHQGIIHGISDGCTQVRIVQSSACASCKVAGHCNASESKEKIIEVYTDDTSGLTIGDNVIVVASQNTGYLAVFLSSVIPLFILVCVLAIVLAATGNEVAAALSSLCALAPYYIILYLFRNKIRSKLSFRLEQP